MFLTPSLVDQFPEMADEIAFTVPITSSIVLLPETAQLLWQSSGLLRQLRTRSRLQSAIGFFIIVFSPHSASSVALCEIILAASFATRLGNFWNVGIPQVG